MLSSNSRRKRRNIASNRTSPSENRLKRLSGFENWPTVKKMCGFNWGEWIFRAFLISIDFSRFVHIILLINKQKKNDDLRFDFLFTKSRIAETSCFIKIQFILNECLISFHAKIMHNFKHQKLSFNIILVSFNKRRWYTYISILFKNDQTFLCTQFNVYQMILCSFSFFYSQLSIKSTVINFQFSNLGNCEIIVKFTKKF